MTVETATADRKSASPRALLALLRIVLGIILVATWFDNLSKGLYTPSGFMGFIDWLAMGEGHPVPIYRDFLVGVVSPNSAVFSSGQRVLELVMGVALIAGALTPLAGGVATLFFSNLFLAYLNPSTEEWIWTYVLLMAVGVAITLGRAGRTYGVDALLLRSRGEPRLPIY